MSDGYDSDSDYNENEKNLLNKYRKSNYQSDDEEPVRFKPFINFINSS